MKPIPVGDDGYYHPSNGKEVVALVNHAQRDGLIVRVRGSAHSVEPAIYTGDFPAASCNCASRWTPSNYS